jgi:perosamine synthetase
MPKVKISNRGNIPLSQPDITEKERKAVLEVLKTPHLALGPKLKEFEQNMAKFAGRKYAIATNSGTSGLHLAIKALGIKKGDEVITSPFSFISSANCALFEQAKPVFVDIDPKTLNIDPDKIEKTITCLPAGRLKKLKAMVIVDIFGHPADWDSILKIAKKYNLKIIEDSCEALGSEYKSGTVPLRGQSTWRKCGSFGDISTFAFYPNKQMTTGEGGIILTDDQKIANYCRALTNQGRKVENGQWLNHSYLGYNYRMSDINAALGVAQLSRIKEILRKRDRVAKMYDQLFGDSPKWGQAPPARLTSQSETGRSEPVHRTVPIKLPYVAPYAKMSWFVYVIQLMGTVPIRGQSHSLRKRRDQILKKLRKQGISCSNYFQCIHLQPLYKEMFGYKRGDFPVAEEISDKTIALPFYNNLTEKEIDYVVKKLKECL